MVKMLYYKRVIIYHSKELWLQMCDVDLRVACEQEELFGRKETSGKERERGARAMGLDTTKHSVRYVSNIIVKPTVLYMK